VLAVSEERGTVSIAEDGRLSAIADAGELRERLERLSARLLSPPYAQGPKWNLMAHWRLKILAVMLAALGWYVLAYHPNTVEKTFVAPIEYRNIPAELTLDGAEPSEARVTLFGREMDFSMLDPASLLVSVDLSAAGPDKRDFSISTADVRHPFTLRVLRIEPHAVHIGFENTGSGAIRSGSGSQE
jgi:hypothetical protein